MPFLDALVRRFLASLALVRGREAVAGCDPAQSRGPHRGRRTFPAKAAMVSGAVGRRELGGGKSEQPDAEGHLTTGPNEAARHGDEYRRHLERSSRTWRAGRSRPTARRRARFVLETGRFLVIEAAQSVPVWSRDRRTERQMTRSG